MDNVILHIDKYIANKELQKYSRRAFLGAYAADITDDGKVIQLHWSLGHCTNLCLQDMLLAYLEKYGIKDIRKKKISEEDDL